ncbi:dihydroorotase [Fictibacillus barbaricus]|uniref:Dihydroorotase n=1 Tax=Fictibacillus barbaricus TaxID=182136 RepID=A0ABS2ZEP1_9BACL|nr:dihydroorotase [Fictibacillus barbaricus]MBN3545916.1 dihydroorotase [Fictibacillus barbaricus]GGB57134.1 dihydroorotase [Fictibacillus barbaricus]
MGYLLKNANILDGNNNLIETDILIENNVIQKVEKDIPAGEHNVLEADRKLVTPGFIDLHVHLREPGGEHKETIATGTKAAVKGGYTTLAAMPNTRPVPDSAETLELVQRKIKDTASCRVLPYASITTRQVGSERTDFETLLKGGAFAFTDDGVGVQSAGMMLNAMKEAGRLGAVIVAHCEDNTLLPKGGAFHEGEFTKKEGLPGIPSVSESVHISRDVLLAEAADARYHVCHVSTKESVRVIRDAKRAGIKVTAEVTPHHLILSDKDIKPNDTHYKMNPPLRSEADREALIQGLKEGTLDFIATDHAPHSTEEKAQDVELAPFGIVGLETAFPLLYTELVLKEKRFTLQELVDKMTKTPAESFNLPYGTLVEGANADLTIVDLDIEEAINANEFVSKGKNTPFDGWVCKGWPIATIFDGKLVYHKEESLV